MSAREAEAADCPSLPPGYSNFAGLLPIRMSRADLWSPMYLGKPSPLWWPTVPKKLRTYVSRTLLTYPPAPGPKQWGAKAPLSPFRPWGERGKQMRPLSCTLSRQPLSTSSTRPG